MTAKEPAHFHTSEFQLSCLHLPVKGKPGRLLRVLETDQIQGHSLPWPQVDSEQNVISTKVWES